MLNGQKCAHAACRAGRRFVLAAAILLSAAAGVAGAEWSEIDSGLPRIVAGVRLLAMDSATPSTLYAVDLGGRLFKSLDSAGSWKLQGGVSNVGFVAVDPRISSTVYAATHHGVLKSIDGGETWAPSGLTDNDVLKIYIDPMDPEADLWATTTNGFFSSPDGAKSWIVVSTPPPGNFFSYTGPYQQIYFNQLAGDTMSTLYMASNDGVATSTDGGHTFTVHSAAPPGAIVLSLAVDPASPSTAYAVYDNRGGWGIVKSMDSGEHWSVLDTGLPSSSDGGAIPLVAVSATTPATVYTGYADLRSQSGRLAKSKDGGVTWSAADTGLTYVDVRAVAIDPVVPSNLYAGMFGAAAGVPLFKSADGGTTWAGLAQFELSSPPWYGSVSAILAGVGNPNSIYAAANADDGYHALFRTKDGGANWVRSGPAPFGALFATVMALDPADANIVYLGYYDPTGDGEAILYKSVDGGATWPNSLQWDIGPLNALVIDPGNRATLYVGTPEGVFKTANGGASWSNIGLGTGVTALALDPGDSSTIYAGAGFLGLFKSTDGGATWAAVNNGLDRALDSRSTVTAIAFAPGNPNRVYVATSGSGVYKSLDGGANWVNSGLTNFDVRLLAIAPNALYAVTTSGIFKGID